MKTCPSDAAATGSGEISENSASIGNPSSRSIISNASAVENGVIRSCKSESSSKYEGGIKSCKITQTNQDISKLALVHTVIKAYQKKHFDKKLTQTMDCRHTT